MKTICAILIFTSALAAQADGLKYICKEKTDFEKRTVILTQVGEENFREGEKSAFILEVFNGNTKTPTLVAEGTVETEDVMFEFKSKDESVGFMIFLDELDQSALTLSEKDKSVQFDCF